MCFICIKATDDEFCFSKLERRRRHTHTHAWTNGQTLTATSHVIERARESETVRSMVSGSMKETEQRQHRYRE